MVDGGGEVKSKEDDGNVDGGLLVFPEIFPLVLLLGLAWFAFDGAARELATAALFKFCLFSSASLIFLRCIFENVARLLSASTT